MSPSHPFLEDQVSASIEFESSSHLLRGLSPRIFVWINIRGILVVGYSCLLWIFTIEGCPTKISIKKEARIKRYGSSKHLMAWLFDFDDSRGSLDRGLIFCFSTTLRLCVGPRKPYISVTF